MILHRGNIFMGLMHNPMGVKCASRTFCAKQRRLELMRETALRPQGLPRGEPLGTGQILPISRIF